MSEIDALRQAHSAARADFEKACAVDHISKEAYETIRERYYATMKAYHEALGFHHAVGSPSASNKGGDNG